jgi:diadenosine tetraphosphate (Ap4A) HIT family hydrolase
MPTMSGLEPSDCPFCRILPERVIDGNQLAFVVADAFPVSPGHTLIIPKRHLSDFLDLTDAEVLALRALARAARDRLQKEFHPDGFNVGANVGSAAGQTIGHVHLHLIPRFVGDVASPEGGIRNVIPGKGAYRSRQNE